MYKKILVVTGADSVWRAAATEGVDLAKAHGAQVVFFAVLPRYVIPMADYPGLGMPPPDEFLRHARSDADRRLAAATVIADKAGVPSRTEVDSGADDAECIVEAARRLRCGLIVVGSSGSNAVMRLLAGSEIPGLITRSKVPVLVVRARRSAAARARQSAGGRRTRPVPRPSAAKAARAKPSRGRS